jgi:hypothetical protein
MTKTAINADEDSEHARTSARANGSPALCQRCDARAAVRSTIELTPRPLAKQCTTLFERVSRNLPVLLSGHRAVLTTPPLTQCPSARRARLRSQSACARQGGHHEQHPFRDALFSFHAPGLRVGCDRRPDASARVQVGSALGRTERRGDCVLIGRRVWRPGLRPGPRKIFAGGGGKADAEKFKSPWRRRLRPHRQCSRRARQEQPGRCALSRARLRAPWPAAPARADFRPAAWPIRPQRSSPG